MRWSLSSAVLFAALVAALAAPPGTAAQELGLEADLDLVVEMPLAVADAFDAGVPADDLAFLARSLVEGALPPADFIEVVTLAPLAYEVEAVEVREAGHRDLDPRRASDGPGLGAYVQRQLERGLRGPELSRAIHRELHRRGIPAGPPGRRVGVRGGDRVALDLGALRELRDRRDRREARGRDRVPPGQLKKDDDGRGRGVPSADAKGRGRGHPKDEGKGRGKGQGPPPPARGGPDDGNGGGR